MSLESLLILLLIAAICGAVGQAIVGYSLGGLLVTIGVGFKDQESRFIKVVSPIDDTPAAKAGLQRGDVVIGFHLWEALTADNVTFVLNHKDLATFSPVKTFFLRDGKVRETYLVPSSEN